MKSHLKWERNVETKEMKPENRAGHENELLYYEQQIDVVGGIINQLKAIASKGKAVREGAEMEPKGECKVGDTVIAKAGPHKGEKHKVIHVFDDGSMNITPLQSRGGNIKYKLGAAKATPDQVEKV